MKHTFRLLAAAAALVIAGGAHALTFQGASTSQGSSVADYSQDGLISFDVEFKGFAPVTLSYALDAMDLPSLDLNALLFNVTAGAPFTGYTLTLSQGTFSTVGSVTRQWSGSASVAAAGQMATISFDSDEYLDVELGNALGTTPGATDWVIGGLNAETGLTLTITPVPEPGSLALMLAGIGVTGFVARRGRQRRG